MGRVFEALKRASAADDKSGAAKRQQPNSERRGGSTNVPDSPSARQIEEQFAGSSILTVSHEAARSSASSAHTADVPDGSALPAGIASRDAGATLDAAGAARLGGYASYDLSPARVEPHLVAVTQPRSPYCGQFRSVPTRILPAGAPLQMRALAVSSSGRGLANT